MAMIGQQYNKLTDMEISRNYRLPTNTYFSFDSDKSRRLIL